MLKVVLVLLAVYLLIGVIRVWLDFREPIHNQPHYVRHATLLGVLFAVLLCPLLLWSDIVWHFHKHR